MNNLSFQTSFLIYQPVMRIWNSFKVKIIKGKIWNLINEASQKKKNLSVAQEALSILQILVSYPSLKIWNTLNNFVQLFSLKLLLELVDFLHIFVLNISGDTIVVIKWIQGTNKMKNYIFLPLYQNFIQLKRIFFSHMLHTYLQGTKQNN